MPRRVAGDQLRIVEIVPGIHPHPRRQPPAHRDLLRLREQRDLDPVHLPDMARDHLEAGLHRLRMIPRPPVARQRRVEHLAQPMDDHRLPHLRENPVIDPHIILRPRRRSRQRPARHQDDPPAEALDHLDLRLVGADHIVQRHLRPGREVIRPRAAGDQRPRPPLRRLQRASDQLPRLRPAQPHAALRGIHRLRHPEPEVPEVVAVADRRLPVDRRRHPRIAVRQRIRHHMRRREGHPVERRLRPREVPRFAGRIRLDPPVRGRQVDLRHLQISSAGTSSQRRSRQLCKPSSASCTPLAPSTSEYRHGASSTMCRRNISHCSLKPLS